jgi:hypothetical protein
MKVHGSHCRFEYIFTVWVRWLRVCALPEPHIAAVLGVGPAELAEYVAPRHARQPSGPPRGLRGRPGSIHAHTATRVRRLADLGYQPDRIAKIVAVPIAAIRSFLARTRPVRGTALVKPRTKAEHTQLIRRQRRRERRLARRPPRPPKPERPVVDPAEAWRYTDNGEPPRSVELPTIAAAEPAELAPIVAKPPAAEPLPTNTWVGPTSIQGGGHTKLGETQIQEASDLLRSGLSYPVVARQFDVSVNTLRRSVGDIGPRRKQATYPTEAQRFSHGVVRWDMGLEPPGRSVLVECDCGRARRIQARDIVRQISTFTGMCDQCQRALWLSGMVPGKGIGEAHYNAKLTESDVLEIRRLHDEGRSMCGLARQFDVSAGNIRAIVRRETWAHL